MRKLLAVVVLLCGAVSAYAATPQKWCSKDGTVITQTADGKTYLNGQVVQVGFEHTDEEDGTAVAVMVYDSRFFVPCP